ncbi:MAG: hypothetical protein KC421_15515 [Anaerolineales bacterium]|nr:hypothetical protein [Anaerolineales bacterium]
MGNKLLVRSYDVGVGDCIYVRIPNGDDDFHILIDCGTIGKVELLKKALKDIEENLLPSVGNNGKKRLDLVVATHRHRDHIKGFDPKFFKNIQINHIWLSAAMDPDHKQAEKTQALHHFAAHAMRGIEKSGLALTPQQKMLASIFGLNNDDAMKALREDLPRANNLTGPSYVHAGQTAKDLGIDLKDAEIFILAPEENIDHFYLGEEEVTAFMGFQNPTVSLTFNVPATEDNIPKNISEHDFRQLQSRLLSNALAFSETDSSLQNNTSVVLLIKWENRRLLFVGDAEWEGEFKEGKHNGSWNVMWKFRSKYLKKPIDFLKIGHHGSHNATPWDSERNKIYEPNKILNSVLPKPKAGENPVSQAVVSTKRTSVYKPIPSANLLVELGSRVTNKRNYFEELEKKKNTEGKTDILDLFDEVPFTEYWEYELIAALSQPQPWRTDLESVLTGKNYVEVEIEPG